MEIGDSYSYTFEDGEQITYKVSTAEELHDYLEEARSRKVLVRSFDDPFRRVVGWAAADADGCALTIMELRDKRASRRIDDWFWERVRTIEGRKAIAERYSVRGS